MSCKIRFAKVEPVHDVALAAGAGLALSSVPAARVVPAARQPSRWTSLRARIVTISRKKPAVGYFPYRARVPTPEAVTTGNSPRRQCRGGVRTGHEGSTQVKSLGGCTGSGGRLTGTLHPLPGSRPSTN